MTPWAVYFADGSVVRGVNRVRWDNSPDVGVLHVVAFDGHGNGRMYTDESGQNIPVRDRSVWTGEESYNPFGWGEKLGALVSDSEYWDSYREACRADR